VRKVLVRAKAAYKHKNINAIGDDMPKFSAPLFDLRRNAMVGKQTVANFLRRSANYVDPQPPVGVMGRLGQNLNVKIPSVNDFDNLLRSKIRNLTYPTTTELLAGGLTAGAAFEIGRNLSNAGRDLGIGAGRYIFESPEELEEVKYSSAAQRVLQRAAQTATKNPGAFQRPIEAVVKKGKYPYAGPGTTDWQKRVYPRRETRRGEEIPNPRAIWKRDQLLLPRNASENEVFAADNREIYAHAGRRLFPIVAASTGLSAAGLGGIGALNYFNRPDGFALSAGNPAHLEGYSFVPDPEESKYSSYLLRQLTNRSR